MTFRLNTYRSHEGFKIIRAAGFKKSIPGVRNRCGIKIQTSENVKCEIDRRGLMVPHRTKTALRLTMARLCPVSENDEISVLVDDNKPVVMHIDIVSLIVVSPGFPVDVNADGKPACLVASNL